MPIQISRLILEAFLNYEPPLLKNNILRQKKNFMILLRMNLLFLIYIF